MADFCMECTLKTFNIENKSDFKGLCIEGQKIKVLCEGCGELVWVDHNGKRIE